MEQRYIKLKAGEQTTIVTDKVVIIIEAEKEIKLEEYKPAIKLEEYKPEIKLGIAVAEGK